MKTWILAMVMLAGVAMSAQDGGRRHMDNKPAREHRDDFTPEQRAELQVKKMTLALDLNEKQQKDIKALLTERGVERQKMVEKFKADREAGKKPTSDERFAMKSKMLDDRIAMKAAMKKILNAEQLVKLEKLKESKSEKITNHHKKFKNARRR